ncbi:MAG: GNAT family N-acetyltransferase, partial [Bacteroidota bacterium]
EFYSWLGGVLPPFRRKGIGNHLSEVMESLAAEAGFSHIWFKTRNRYPEMLRLGIRRGYQIVKLEPQPNVMDYRIFLRKSLKGL